MNLEHPNYTLVAYKSDGFSICMGHVDESYSSDFQLHANLRMDECLTKHAQLRRIEYGDQEPHYDLTVLYRGVPLMDAGTPIYELYQAALEAEIEDQNAAAQRTAADAEVTRAEQEAEAQALAQEQTRAKEMRQLSELAQKLNFEVIPKADHAATA